MAEQKKAAESDLLAEENDAQRDGKFMVLGARRAGGQMVPIAFYGDRGQADAAASALVATGFQTVEVYIRVSAHSK